MSLKQGLLANILERQRAAGITTPWSEGSPTDVSALIDTADTPVYDEAELRAYCNHIAPSFVDEAAGWAAGATAAPTFYSGSLFDAGDDSFDAINTKLQTLRRTALAWNSYGPPYQAVYQSAADTLEAAQSLWAQSGSDNMQGPLKATLEYGRPAGWLYYATRVSGHVTVSLPDAGITATIRYYAKTVDPGAGFSAQGDVWVSGDGQYGEVGSAVIAAGDTSATVANPTPTMPFPTDAGASGAGEYGYAVTASRWLAEWDFSDWGGVPASGDYDADHLSPGQIVVSRQKGEDVVFRRDCDADQDPPVESWTVVTPAAEDFPADPANGDVWADEDRGLEWTWIAALSKWRAAYAGRVAERLVPGVHIVRITVPAGETTVVYERTYRDCPDNDVLLAVIPVPSWATSWRVTGQTHRSALITFGTAPDYESTVDVLVHSVAEVR